LLEKAMKRVVDDTTKLVERDFHSTTSTFNERSKAKFTRERAKREGSDIVGSVWTADKNYVRLNDGTPDHMVGRNRQLMSFHPKYRKKTHPGVIKSRRGGPSGKRVVARGPWRVKGIEARYFAGTIALKHTNPFRKRVQEAIAALAGGT
jgi:hypothetical protein